MLETLHKLGHAATARIVVRNALNPALWLCGIVTPTCFVAAHSFREHPALMWFIIIVGIMPIVVACGMCVGFALFSPRHLQSEDYQIRHEALQIIQQKSGEIPVKSPSLEAIANPGHATLANDSKVHQ